jgi:ATP-dependent helicase/nuclease subunit B
MLSVVALHSPIQKLDLFQRFDPVNTTWVVSDLRNKFEFQQLVLEKQNFFEDLSVYRASELWRFLLKKTRPEIQLISKDVIRVWLAEQIEKDHSNLSQQTEQVVIDMMDQMASVFLHPEGTTRMQDWLRENPESLQRWGTWYLLAEKYSQKLIDNNRASPSWIAAILLNENQWESFWKRPLVFDLGSQLSVTEAELIFSISKTCDVTVLMPQPSWGENFKYLLQGYEYLLSKANSLQKTEKTNPKSGETRALRFSGVLGEAKAAVAMARLWLDQGVPAHQIALIAPDVEKYWPVLHTLLETEGIPCAKDVSIRLQTLPSVGLWISDLKLAAGQVIFSDLENSYAFEPKNNLAFEEFYSLFSEMLSAQDLRRHQEIQNSFSTKFSGGDILTTEQWIGFAASHWRANGDFAPLEIILREFMTQVESSQSLKLSSWIQLLESLTSKKEIRVQKGNLSGVQITNLSSADSVTFSHRFFLGLSESQIRESKRAMLTPKEVLNIASQLGFYLQHPEVSQLEFDLGWNNENLTAQTFLSFPQTGFAGGAEAPAALWLSHNQVSSIPAVRWDQLISQKPNSLRLQEDLGLQARPALRLADKISLSPSSLETYRKCAFIFASQKIFRLADLPTVDLDVDRRTRGQLAHAVLEKICEEPRRFDWKAEEIRDLILTLREPLNLLSMDNFVWLGLVEKHVQMALRFLQFESAWKNQFPETKVAGREVSLEFAWDLETGKLRPKTEGLWKIRGKIDRVDSDRSGNLVILDYKMTAQQKNGNAGNWLKDNQLQLALYMLAVESGAVAEIPASQVVGAFFYVLKNLNRDRGMKLEENAGTLFDLDKKKNRLNSEQKRELLEAIEKVVQQTILGISKGEFPASPLDESDCKTCSWRSLCRAPHLN